MRRPASEMVPPAMRPGGSSRPMMAAPVMDLPAPDSPTTPSTSPGWMLKETSSSATSVPRRVGNSTRRFFTSSRGNVLDILPQLRIEGVAQPVAQEIDGEHEDDQREPGEDG